MASTLTLYTGVPDTTVRLWSEKYKPEWAATIEEGHSSEGAWDERKTDGQGNTSFMFVPEGLSTAYLTKPGYKAIQVHYDMPADGAHVVGMEREAIQRVKVNGQRFRNVLTGRPWFLKGASMFTLFQRYLDNEELRPIMEQLQALGVNCIRVFGMFHYINVNEFGKPAFKPQDYGDKYYNNAGGFCKFAASYGMYVYWSCFPDNEFIMPKHEERLGHYKRLTPILEEEPNTLFELTNEQDAHAFNAVDANLYPRPQHMPSCAGSYGDVSGPMPGPYWDFLDYHTPRYYPAGIKDCAVADHPNFIQGCAILIGEPDRFGSNGNPNTEQARQCAGTSIGTALGIVFHSRNGVRGESLDPTTMESARAFFSSFTLTQEG